MAIAKTNGHLRVMQDRKFEDYRSLKQYYRNHNIEELIYSGYQISTATKNELDFDDATALAYLGANDIVYVKSEANLAALDGDSVYITYLTSAGVVTESETLLDSATSTDTEVPIGCESGTKVDTVAAVNGDVLTMTGLNSSVANDLAGEYVVGVSGDQKGNYLTILSNTAASPTLITCTTTPNANWAADVVSVQAKLHNDVYRIREMSCETEAPTDNNIWCCDHDGSNKYGIISDASSRAAPSRYFVPKVTTGQNSKYYLGFIDISTQRDFEADNDALGYKLTITYTPKENDANVPAADILLEKTFMDHLHWEPCIELEPATDVIIEIHKILDANHDSFFIEYGFLEVDRLAN